MFRIGHGFDVHRLVKNRPLILGGVAIPFDYGLAGHSDADVLIHAICDALLGAKAMGDIGQHFPPGDADYLNIASSELLRAVMALPEAFVVLNLDATIVAEAPKMAPFIMQMRANIAEILGIGLTQVNIKATTTEGLGYCGRQEGIAAHAVVLLRLLDEA